ncbi:outer membrane lipoprotein chaperone LolA [Chitinimonas sp. BJB300]|uniref:outer membrane lipoprotein chaperone LolA n=1 Tax=Chitinimonas sp. BJB300 TaxID=1559339 RepID=UPI000C1057DC|nr:outer membrane lipoprotein chaperone LolA [Chitinimonas sp. BJB300]PHV11023.1 outer membrane lipoprotein carrier protein LolA [Chitinimonas sp. BJB300]TSJ86055.1 outer membrane lipoprotein chaperone LolA [Chitinimonas sp. BJB300]
MRYLLLLALSLPSFAGGLEQLNNFLEQTKGFTAEFQQTVTQKAGKQQQASGTMAILRPGRFDWLYTKPYEQRVVGDGKQLWIYDPDLNQVTNKQLDRALGDSPAALLAGSNNLDKTYTLADAGKRDGLEWVEATPKNRDTGFERVRIGFKDAQPIAMELADSFGQTTQIRFSKVVRNPKLDAERFHFTPPKGADVVSAD